MNFLAHLWLADQARLPLAGAVLGDYLRGPVPAKLPAALALSVNLHRRLDAETDRHPRVVTARARFGPGTRRYAGILLDILYDHLLTQDWTRYSSEPLERFVERAAREVAAEAGWFEQAGGPAPLAFGALLLSYRTQPGIEQALHRTARRLSKPQGLLNAMAGWTAILPLLRADLPVLLEDLRGISVRFAAASQAG